jgi:hypothetical protein
MGSPANMPMSAPPPGPQGAPAPPSAQPTPAVVQIVGGITELTAMLKAVYPPSAPDVQAIQQSLQNIQQSMAQTQSPAQTQAPPI